MQFRISFAEEYTLLARIAIDLGPQRTSNSYRPGSVLPSFDGLNSPFTIRSFPIEYVPITIKVLPFGFTSFISTNSSLTSSSRLTSQPCIIAFDLSSAISFKADGSGLMSQDESGLISGLTSELISGRGGAVSDSPTAVFRAKEAQAAMTCG